MCSGLYEDHAIGQCYSVHLQTSLEFILVASTHLQKMALIHDLSRSMIKYKFTEW